MRVIPQNSVFRTISGLVKPATLNAEMLPVQNFLEHPIFTLSHIGAAAILALPEIANDEGIPVALAIFDLDNTLIAGDSDHRWGLFLIEKQLVDAEHYRIANDAFYEDYKNGTLDIRAYLQFSLKPLTHHTLGELKELHDEFMRSYIEPIMLPKAKALLQHHREQGDYLLIITATNSFVTRPIGNYLAVDDLLATDPEQIDGRYTGNFVGTPCFQAGKVTRLQEWLQSSSHSLDGAYFYSDSLNDLPLLEQVEHPIAVDPDPKLQQIARERGWNIISLRD